MDLRDNLDRRFTQAAQFYLNDLEALPHELLLKSWGGKSRSAYDFTYEVVEVNRRMAQLLRNQPMDPFWETDYPPAPEQFCCKEACLSAYRSSIKDLEEAWAAITAENLNHSEGEWSPARIMTFIPTHLMYHDAQLNFIQAMSGDASEHWN